MRRKVVVALATALFFYALSDVLLWQRIFEAHDLVRFDDQYQSGHVTTLVALIAVGVVLLWDLRLWALWWAAALYTLTFGGLEDILYYWLDGKPIPATLPWLDGYHNLILFHPASPIALIGSALLWIAFWIATLRAVPVAERLMPP